jgi:hypothetical protein
MYGGSMPQWCVQGNRGAEEALRNRTPRTSGIEGLYVRLNVWVRQECQYIASIRALRVKADDRDMLVDTSGKNVLRDYASTPKCDAISCDVKKNVIGLENHTTQSIRLFVRNECKPIMVKTTVENVLASHKSEPCATRQIGICSALWCCT